MWDIQELRFLHEFIVMKGDFKNICFYSWTFWQLNQNYHALYPRNVNKQLLFVIDVMIVVLVNFDSFVTCFSARVLG